MTQYGAPFDGILLGDATVAPYSAAEWARIWRLQQGAGASFPNYGVFSGSGSGGYGPLEVRATTVISSNVEVQIGAAMVDGHFYESTAAETLSVSANASGSGRVDTVILRLDYIGQTIRLVVKQGTPAGSPVAPTLQQDATYWEIPLANIAVANGFVTLAQTTITNRQRAMHSIAAGWQAVAYPLNHSVTASYDSATVTFASAPFSIAVPMAVIGNLLVQDVYIRHVTTPNQSYTLDWGLYFQDVNDGNSAEKTLRRVAIGTLTQALTGTGNVAIPASPAPQILTPGLYWLVLRAPSLLLGVIAGNSFDSVGYRQGSIAGAFAQTLDMDTGWTTLDTSPAVRLRGRVFGLTAVL